MANRGLLGDGRMSPQRTEQRVAQNLPRISIVSPVYGCASCLEELVDRIATALARRPEQFEVILVDDRSRDGAWARITELAANRPWLRALRLSRNFGQHQAILAGLQASRGDWVVVMDCDLQDSPAAIPALLAHAEAQALDFVVALRQHRKDRWHKRLASAMFYRLLSWLTGMAQDSRASNFGIYCRRMVDAIAAMPEQGLAFPLMVRWIGFAGGTLEVEHAPRHSGTSTYGFRKLLRLATNIALGYSDKPLRLVATGGIVFSVFAFVLVAVSIYRWWQGDIQVAGFTSIIASIWLVAGALMVALGVVGLYVGQVFRNAQGRPRFVIDRRLGEGPDDSVRPQGEPRG